MNTERLAHKSRSPSVMTRTGKGQGEETMGESKGEEKGYPGFMVWKCNNAGNIGSDRS